MKTGARRFMRPDELPFVVRRSRHISKESSSRRIMCPSLYLRRITRRTTKAYSSSSRGIMRPWNKKRPLTTSPYTGAEGTHVGAVCFFIKLMCSGYLDCLPVLEF